MNIKARIDVLTVVNKDAMVVYQTIHVNDREGAIKEYDGLQDKYASLLREGGTVTRFIF